jgi:regulator of nucleoside diphosphate kinase
METIQLIIQKKDKEILQTHLSKSQMSDFNKKRLITELKNALIVKDDALPAKQNKISVFAPIGIALLGYKVGSKVQWEMPNGLKTFEILGVEQKLAEHS